MFRELPNFRDEGMEGLGLKGLGLYRDDGFGLGMMV